jgi:hypothetical protein
MPSGIEFKEDLAQAGFFDRPLPLVLRGPTDFFRTNTVSRLDLANFKSVLVRAVTVSVGAILSA